MIMTVHKKIIKRGSRNKMGHEELEKFTTKMYLFIKEISIQDASGLSMLCMRRRALILLEEIEVEIEGIL